MHRLFEAAERDSGAMATVMDGLRRAFAIGAGETLRHSVLILAVAIFVASRFLLGPVRGPAAIVLDGRMAAVLVIAISAAVGMNALMAVIQGFFRVPSWAEMARGVLERGVGGALGAGAIVLTAAVFLDWKADLGTLVPFRWDGAFADVDRVLHLGRDPWTLIHSMMAPFTRWMEVVYYPVWLVGVYALAGVIAFSTHRRRMQFLVAWVMTWGLLGVLAARLLASAGPIYFEFVGGDDRYAGLLAHLAAWPNRTAEGAAALWLIVEEDVWPRFGISAMPSLHVAIATLYALMGWATNRFWGLLATGFCVVILLGSVHLGWHYAVDGYVSILAVAAIWWFAGRLTADEPTARPRVSL
jgi:hypothetical protein